jgi:hypothetical protein
VPWQFLSDEWAVTQAYGQMKAEMGMFIAYNIFAAMKPKGPAPGVQTEFLLF